MAPLFFSPVGIMEVLDNYTILYLPFLSLEQIIPSKRAKHGGFEAMKAGKPCGNFKWLAILDFSQLIGFAAESVCAQP